MSRYHSPIWMMTKGAAAARTRTSSDPSRTFLRRRRRFTTERQETHARVGRVVPAASDPPAPGAGRAAGRAGLRHYCTDFTPVPVRGVEGAGSADRLGRD